MQLLKMMNISHIDLENIHSIMTLIQNCPYIYKEMFRRILIKTLMFFLGW